MDLARELVVAALAAEGAVVDDTPTAVEALLPATTAADLGLAEEISIDFAGGGGPSCGIGIHRSLSKKKGSIRMMHPMVKFSRESAATLRYLAMRVRIASSVWAPFFSANASQARPTGSTE